MSKKAIVAPDEVVQDAYLDWLLLNLHADHFDEDSRLLLIHLHLLEWYSVLSKDISREEDGKNIRVRFIRDTDFINYDAIMGPCTVLECLVGIAERMDFFCTPPEDQSMAWLYLWRLLSNGGILGNGVDIRKIDIAVDRVMSRTYSVKGKGGLFPLRNASANQIGMEIWYQMSAYIEEHPQLYRELCDEYLVRR